MLNGSIKFMNKRLAKPFWVFERSDIVPERGIQVSTEMIEWALAIAKHDFS
jgi:hypothetical protein